MTSSSRPLRPMNLQGFTIIEFVVASAIGVLVFASLVKGYNILGRRVQFASYSLAANMAAMRTMEQIISYPWIPSQNVTTLLNPPVANPISTNLCLPRAEATNDPDCLITYTVTPHLGTPPFATVWVQVIWTNGSVKDRSMGVFTNYLATVRAPNSP